MDVLIYPGEQLNKAVLERMWLYFSSTNKEFQMQLKYIKMELCLNICQ